MTLVSATEAHGVNQYSVTYDAASLATVTIVDMAVPVPGVLLASDAVITVTPPAALNAGLQVQSARVTADGTITVRMYNSTAGSLDAASGTWTFYVARF